MNCYALIPLALSLVYFLGRLYGRTAHDRTYYSSFYELFLLLTAVYIAPLGGVSVALTLGALLVALVAIFLLRWFVGDKGLLPTGQLLRKRYPWLYRFCTAVESGAFICLTPYFLPRTSLQPAIGDCPSCGRPRGATLALLDPQEVSLSLKSETRIPIVLLTSSGSSVPFMQRAECDPFVLGSFFYALTKHFIPHQTITGSRSLPCCYRLSIPQGRSPGGIIVL